MKTGVSKVYIYPLSLRGKIKYQDKIREKPVQIYDILANIFVDAGYNELDNNEINYFKIKTRKRLNDN